MIVLGVTFQLENMNRGYFKVQNKQGRAERILQVLKEIREEGRFAKNRSAVLMGLLNFAGRLVLGRSLKFPIRNLSNHGVRCTNAAMVEAFL